MTQKIAFVFPGQGSQSVGMLNNIAVDHPIVQKTFQEASEVLGYDLWDLTQKGPEEKLNQTEYTQPAILVASVALWRLWQLKKGELPLTVLAGHSLGEYTALVCANSLALNDAVSLVALRGRLMQEAVPAGQGAMAAILGLNEEVINALCETETKAGELVAPANYNAIGQTVIAGHVAAVLRVMELAKNRQAKRVIRLPVSVPSHCELMKPAALLLKEALSKISFKLPLFPVIHNVDVSEHHKIEEIRHVLVEQLYRPVRWVETVRLMAHKGVTTILECGPGAVLSGLNKRIVATLTCQSLASGGEMAWCP